MLSRYSSSFFGLTTVDKTVRDKIGIGKWRRGHLIPTRDVPTFFLEFSEWNPGDFWALDSMFRTTLVNVLTRELLKTSRHFCHLLSSFVCNSGNVASNYWRRTDAKFSGWFLAISVDPLPHPKKWAVLVDGIASLLQGSERHVHLKFGHPLGP